VIHGHGMLVKFRHKLVTKCGQNCAKFSCIVCRLWLTCV